MSKEVYIENDKIILKYKPYDGVHIIVKNFMHDVEINIGKLLTLDKINLLYEINSEDDCAEFIIGYKTNDFFVINKKIIGTRYDVMFDNNITLDSKLLA